MESTVAQSKGRYLLFPRGAQNLVQSPAANPSVPVTAPRRLAQAPPGSAPLCSFDMGSLFGLQTRAARVCIARAAGGTTRSVSDAAG
jgi:hypothetical protein